MAAALAGAALALCCGLVVRAEAGSVTAAASWERLIKAKGAVDIAGPAGDGRFRLSAGGRLFSLRPSGEGKRPFARGPRGYRSEAGEPYIALAAETEAVGGCRFREDDLFALEPRRPPGLVRIRDGRSRPFARFPRGLFLSGITFDRGGSFGSRLLVPAVDRDDETTLYAVDCAGRRAKLTTGAPRVEGGIAIAPDGFGEHSGRLIAVDERSGRIFAFGAAGEVETVLAETGLPTGSDTGVESIGFVPPGFGPDDRALLADRGISRKPRVGTDSVLALEGAELIDAGVAPGDLLVATEAGAKTIRVRCALSCEANRIGAGPAAAHAEGHIAFTTAG